MKQRISIVSESQGYDNYALVLELKRGERADVEAIGYGPNINYEDFKNDLGIVFGILTHEFYDIVKHSFQYSFTTSKNTVHMGVFNSCNPNHDDYEKFKVENEFLFRNRTTTTPLSKLKNS